MEAARKAKAAARPAIKKVSKAFYSTMITDSGACLPAWLPAWLPVVGGYSSKVGAPSRSVAS